MRLTLMIQNVARGGLHDSSGNYKDRWPALAERINEVKPDILLLNELNGWKDYGHKQLVRATNDLDMEAAPLSPTQTGYGTGLLFRQSSVGRMQYHNASLSYATTHGFAVTGFDIGLPHLLMLAPVHFSFYSAQKAVEEAQLVINKTLPKSPFSIIAGDCNHSPASDPNPDFRKARAYNWAARTVIESGEDIPVSDFMPNRQVAWTLKRGGFVDAAWELYERTRDKTLLKPTVGYDRIDQFWISKSLSAAIESYQLTVKNSEATDHAGVVLVLNTDKVDTNLNWKPEEL